MARKQRVLTPEELKARDLTAVWNSPIQATNTPAECPPLLSGVPWFDSPDSFGGHPPTCGCNDCFAAFATRGIKCN